MPCYLTGSAQGDAELSAAEARKEAIKLARMLCKVMESLEENHCLWLAGFEAMDWWKEHKKLDRKRQKKKKSGRLPKNRR